MAQVNSEAGKNQIFANAAVPPASAEVGPTSSTKVLSTSTIVAYGQHEPGLLVNANGALRS